MDRPTWNVMNGLDSFVLAKAATTSWAAADGTERSAADVQRTVGHTG